MEGPRPQAIEPARGRVVAVASSPGHTLRKQVQSRVEIVAGHGIAGDAHGGTTVKHRNRVRPGLLAATRIDDGRGDVERKAGIMCVALEGGFVAPGDAIRVEAPARPLRPLEVV